MQLKKAVCAAAACGCLLAASGCRSPLAFLTDPETPPAVSSQAEETAGSETGAETTLTAETTTTIVTETTEAPDMTPGKEPKLFIDAATVSPTGLTLTIVNGTDKVRDYGLVYRIVDTENDSTLIRHFDQHLKMERGYTMQPGDSMVLELDWKDDYGSLLEGHYAVEIDLLPEGAAAAQTYTKEFVLR